MGSGPFSSPTGFEIPRDRWGRPLIVPPGGGKPVPYQRVTTFVDVLDDKRALYDWGKRMVALGLSERPDLVLAVSAHRDDKDELNRICEQALEAAKGNAAATRGTAIHYLTAQVDQGLTLPPLPEDARRDIDAYRAVTAGMEMVHVEKFVVNDSLRVAGTADRFVRIDGVTYCADIKTSADLRYGTLAYAMQIALYAHSVAYDPATGEREPIPGVDLNSGIIIHVPAGEGRAQLYWVDIAAGWKGVQIAQTVKEWRARKGLATPFETPPAVTTDRPPVDPAPGPNDRLAFYVRNAGTLDKLNELWRNNRDVWTDELTELAAHRKRELLAKRLTEGRKP